MMTGLMAAALALLLPTLATAFTFTPPTLPRSLAAASGIFVSGWLPNFGSIAHAELPTMLISDTGSLCQRTLCISDVAAYMSDPLVPLMSSGPAASAASTLFLAGLATSFFVSEAILLKTEAPPRPLLKTLEFFTQGKQVRDLASEGSVVQTFVAGAALPTWDELADACVIVAENANGGLVHICAQPSSDDKVDCSEDYDFSDYYGRPVFLCTEQDYFGDPIGLFAKAK